MTQTSATVLELIQALTNQEKKIFSQFALNTERNPAIYKLFELYLRYAEKGESVIREKAEKLPGSASFHTLNQELFDAICDALCYFHKDEMKSLYVYGQLQRIYFLISKNLKTEAVREVTSLKNKLQNTPQRSMIPLLYGIETYLNFAQEEYETLFNNLQKHKQHTLPLQEFKEMLDTRNNLYATNILNLNGTKLSKKAIAAGTEFIESYKKNYGEHTAFVSPLAQLNHLNGLVANKQLDIELRFKAAIDQFHLIKSKPSEFTLETHIMTAYNAVYMAYLTSDFKSGNEYYQALKKIKTVTHVQKQYKAELLLEAQLIQLSIQKKYAEIADVILQFEKERKSKKRNHQESFLAKIYHFKIFSNILLGEAAENKKLLMRFSTSEIKRIQPELFECYRILEIINAIELKDFDFVVYLIRNAKLSFKKNKALSELIQILELLKNSVELHSFSKRNVLLKRCNELYNQLYGKDQAHYIFNYFNLTDWITNKLR